MGNAFGFAQFGGLSPTAKPSRGFALGALEIVESYDGNRSERVHGPTRESDLRSMRFRRSRRLGFGRAKWDVDLVAERLKTAARDSGKSMANRRGERRGTVIRGTRNVFADLGFPDAAERQVKLRLAYALNQVLEDQNLSQADAARAIRVTQPKVSALRNYKLAGFSVERLMNLLTALDQDVDIVIRRKPPSRKTGRISVVAA